MEKEAASDFQSCWNCRHKAHLSGKAQTKHEFKSSVYYMLVRREQTVSIDWHYSTLKEGTLPLLKTQLCTERDLMDTRAEHSNCSVSFQTKYQTFAGVDAKNSNYLWFSLFYISGNGIILALHWPFVGKINSSHIRLFPPVPGRCMWWVIFTIFKKLPNYVRQSLAE